MANRHVERGSPQRGSKSTDDFGVHAKLADKHLLRYLSSVFNLTSTAREKRRYRSGMLWRTLVLEQICYEDRLISNLVGY